MQRPFVVKEEDVEGPKQLGVARAEARARRYQEAEL